MPVWIVIVALLVSLLVSLFSWLERAAKAGQLDSLFALRIEADRLAAERARIHGPAYPYCPSQTRLLLIPLGRQCPPCAANTRQRRALVSTLPWPLRLLNRALAPLLFLAQRIVRARTGQTARRPARAGMLRGTTMPGIVRRRRNRREAAQHRAAAEGGDIGAQYRLGVLMYHAGDHAEAEAWYRRAVDQGHVKAMVNLGLLLYFAGRDREGLALFEQAAARGDPSGAYNAWLAAKNLGDPMAGHTWLLRAAELGHVGAEHELRNRCR